MEILDLTIKLDLSLGTHDLEVQAEQLFKIAESAVPDYINKDDLEIHVWVEQGSVTKRTKYILGWSLFFNTVCNIDSFVGGLEKIYGYSEKAMNYIAQKVVEPSPSRVLEIKRSGGMPDKILKEMEKVQQGKHSPEEATEQVMKLIKVEVGDEKTKEQFITLFNSAAEQRYRSPLVQLPLFPGFEIETLTKRSQKKKPKKHIPKQYLSLQGIELWYDKKTGRREVRRYSKR